MEVESPLLFPDDPLDSSDCRDDFSVVAVFPCWVEIDRSKLVDAALLLSLFCRALIRAAPFMPRGSHPEGQADVQAVKRAKEVRKPVGRIATTMDGVDDAQELSQTRRPVTVVGIRVVGDVSRVMWWCYVARPPSYSPKRRPRLLLLPNPPSFCFSDFLANVSQVRQSRLSDMFANGQEANVNGEQWWLMDRMDGKEGAPHQENRLLQEAHRACGGPSSSEMLGDHPRLYLEGAHPGPSNEWRAPFLKVGFTAQRSTSTLRMYSQCATMRYKLYWQNLRAIPERLCWSS